MECEVVSHTAYRADTARVTALAGAALAVTGRTADRISVSYVDRPTIRELNRRHRDRDAETDVLSWPFDPSFPQGSGGEVVICPEVVDSRPEALDELLVHGVLHLAGHRDDTARGRDTMAALTDTVLRKAARG